MADKWQPVVGGRAWWNDEAVLVCEFGPDGSAMIVSAESDIEDNREFWVQLADLREHAEDERHRRLLEAALEVRAALGALERGEDTPLTADECERLTAAHLKMFAIIAEHDAAGQG